ncbi:FRG domain-containing protein [Butyrivibrio sp. FC2001]|uniref:FRG domain-containing protein n=1 Tax=Butyrivibrio sp. FC2001 TaxID=1280671 RepID=UPI00041879EE|nr:FRG domain-containing protein [Butyrivibrio sp. FC2001]
MSIKTVKITTKEQINDLIWNQQPDDGSGRYRSTYIFRGLPNSDYKLATTLHRNCTNKSSQLEASLLRNFTKYASIEDESLRNSVWKQLVIGQHHGLPTRLLDWTYSVLIALHFATSGELLNSMDEYDAAVWQIDIKEMNSKLPPEYQKTLKDNSAYLMTVDMLEELSGNNGYKSLEDYDVKMNKTAMVILEPPSIDQRIINQYSYFSVIPDGMENLNDDEGIEKFLYTTTSNTCKYIIDKNLKWRIRDMLDQMNINERTVYPGLDGLTKWLGRHYYVKH